MNLDLTEYKIKFDKLEKVLNNFSYKMQKINTNNINIFSIYFYFDELNSKNYLLYLGDLGNEKLFNNINIFNHENLLYVYDTFIVGTNINENNKNFIGQNFKYMKMSQGGQKHVKVKHNTLEFYADSSLVLTHFNNNKFQMFR